MKAFLRFIPLYIFIPSLCFVIYCCCNDLNPNSRFCLYGIYKQTDGTYQVWWICKTEKCEARDLTYEQAKQRQVELCDEFKEFLTHRPKAVRVTGEFIK